MKTLLMTLPLLFLLTCITVVQEARVSINIITIDHEIAYGAMVELIHSSGALTESFKLPTNTNEIVFPKVPYGTYHLFISHPNYFSLTKHDISIRSRNVVLDVKLIPNRGETRVFLISNRTNETINSLFIRDSRAMDWGENILSRNLLHNERYIIYLFNEPVFPSSLDIRLIGRSGDLYTKYNIYISNNDIVEFTINDKKDLTITNFRDLIDSHRFDVIVEVGKYSVFVTPYINFDALTLSIDYQPINLVWNEQFQEWRGSFNFLDGVTYRME